MRLGVGKQNIAHLDEALVQLRNRNGRCGRNQVTLLDFRILHKDLVGEQLAQSKLPIAGRTENQRGILGRNGGTNINDIVVKGL